MQLSDFDFDLPQSLIATRPAKPRSSARLLVATPTRLIDGHVGDLVDWFQAGDRLVLNDTKVLPARLTGQRGRDTAQGYQEAKVEVTLLDPQSTQGQWRVLIKPLKKVKEGEVIRFSDDLSATLESKTDGTALITFNVTGDAFDTALNAAGAMPLPPYIEALRKADAQDKEDYQTVWAKNLGAVAAPTASLHFDTPLLEALRAKGVTITYVTLHVGAGTFLPVKVDNVDDHKMHAEWGEVSPEAVSEILATKAAGGRVIPVGTTALRLIESAARATGQIAPFVSDTDIFIRPGFTFHVADALMTNFHLPKSTLMMLVSAVLGQERIKQVYAHAITQEYRFFSYGDASLLLPKEI
jgi:S-adenosylmethionine:tRNA ribosyltransferase-isomerase